MATDKAKTVERIFIVSRQYDLENTKVCSPSNKLALNLLSAFFISEKRAAS
jgi:hypothetical protein